MSAAGETPEQRLKSIGITLPDIPRPVANFVPWRVQGSTVYLAGQVCEWNGSVVLTGKVGVDYELEAAREAARVCGLNLLAALREAVGSLDRVTGCLRLGGFVNCSPDYPLVPHVVNGASDLMHEVFGPKVGAHVRTAVGVAMLPFGAAVEVDGIFAVEPAA